MEIRRASEEDIPEMVLLLKSLFSIEADFNFDEAKQRRGLQLILAEDARKACALVAVNGNGNVQGMVTMQLVLSTAEGAPSGWIEDMVIAPELRRRGIGRALLQSIVEWGKAQGATRFQLLADKDNTPALEYYRKLGWNVNSMICLRLGSG